MPNKIIEVRNLVKKYERRRPVLDGMTFSIDEREFVTIYGKSGCGKTTLLNILGGLDRPTSGVVEIDGDDIAEISEDRLAEFRLNKIGFVFQDFNLLTDLTVRENVGLPLRFSGNKDEQRVDELLAQFEIEDISGQTANRISGGEAQRTAIARAMMNRPRLLLADEPTGNLDAENTENVMGILRGICHDSQTTILLATHDMELAHHASSSILISDGMAVYDRLNRQSTGVKSDDEGAP